jgi:phage terminase large subunit GpA-like protein
MREPMEKMGLTCSATRVSLMMAAQIAKTQATLNLLGQIAHEQPCPVLVVLPSIDEARSYNRDKLQPMIDNSPAIAARVMDVKRADGTGSTTAFKRFPGGSIELTGANSSKGLQMRTKRVLILDEVSEFPFDVDGRGDPVEMAEKRTMAYGRRAKIIKVSTPGLEGACRIAASYNAGSRGEYHVPCPHCGTLQALTFDRLSYRREAPQLAEYACVSCGAMCRESDKAAMLAGGRWEHERPDLLATHPTYRLSTLYSPFVEWGWVAVEREKSRDDPQLDKVFTQQVPGEPWRPKYDTVPHQILWERRTEWPAGRIPPAVVFLEGATDVQEDRLEWAVYGFDRDFGQWWIDGGVISGDPMEGAVWAAHDVVMMKQWTDAWGHKRAPESWGIDAGFLSQEVYRYVRPHASRVKPFVMALDGRPDWNMPPIGPSKAVTVNYLGKKAGAVLLWPVGTWDLKVELNAAMVKTQQGPDDSGRWPIGAMRFPTRLDIGFFEQLTAEACQVVSTRNGYEKRAWVKVRRRNEALDLAVYARALARRDTDGVTQQGWDRLVANRQTGETPSLIALMQPTLATEIEQSVAETTRPTVAPRQPRQVGGIGRSVV